MSTFTVDVIVNNYNYALYLGEAIDSAIAQTYRHVRVIVVDDGSTDRSREVIESYGDRIVSVFKENGGQASALNTGFEYSSGNAVIFLDSDDTLVPDIAKRVVTAFSANATLTQVHYPMEVIDSETRHTGVRKPPSHIPLRSGDLREQKLAFPFDLTWMATSGNAFARWSLLRILPIPEHAFRLGADWYLTLLIPILGPVKALEDVGAYYRVHGQNSYELAEAELDLDHVRQRLVYTDRVRPHLTRLAREEGLQIPGDNLLSVSDIGFRLISVRLERKRHPIQGDTVPLLLASSVRAVARRFDVRWPMKVMFLVWFAMMAIAPRPLAHILAERFAFPERREMLNRLLALLHRSDRGDRGTVRHPT